MKAILFSVLFHTAWLAGPISAEPLKVEIRGTPGKYQLFRDGQPYAVRGAGVDGGDLVALKRYGGNSIRTWHVDETILDKAHALGLTVSLCLNIARERHGFDYNDATAVQKQFDEARAAVLKYRDHPALLSWIIGNELNYDYQNPRVFDAVNEISKMIHELDPNHPTTTATASISESLYQDIRERASDLDFLSIQVYGALYALPGYIDDFHIDMPIMVTEWGTIGHWEVLSTAWGAPLELTSTEKAYNYRRGYLEVISALRGKVIGSYAFFWGQKQERTPTWYGTFTAKGEETETVDSLRYLWTGSWPNNRAPSIESISLDHQAADEDITLISGEAYSASVQAKDMEGDVLSYVWSVMKESDSTQSGGDREKIPDVVVRIDESTASSIRLVAPEETGAYRLYVYVADTNGRVAHANVPFYTSPAK